VLVAIAALIGLAFAWTLGPLAGTFDPASLAEKAERLREWPPAPLVIVVFFVLANAVAAPVTPMIATTVLLFGTMRGSLYAYAGMLASASAVYAIGRFAARDLVVAWLAARTDPRFATINQRVARRGLLTAALVRLTPIPFPLQNVALGASPIGYADFLFGTMLGIVPAILLIAGLAVEFEAWLAAPDATHLALLIAAVLIALAIGWGIRRWAARRS
jgi:uncharacterized membrane protein YdjX (TVP38/TMEM64 family)